MNEAPPADPFLAVPVPVPVPESEAEHAAEPTRCCLKRLRKATGCSAKKTGHGHGHEQNAGTAEPIGVSIFPGIPRDHSDSASLYPVDVRTDSNALERLVETLTWRILG